MTASGLDADEAIIFEMCLTEDTGGEQCVAEVVHRSGKLLSEINEVAYTVLISGLTLDYIVSVIANIRKRFSKCTVIDLRNNAMAVSQFSGTGDMAGKCIVVDAAGEVTLSEDSDRSQLLSAVQNALKSG